MVCHCGINIGSVVNVPSVVEYAKTLPNVIHAEEAIYACSRDNQEKIKTLIQEKNLNRFVVASARREPMNNYSRIHSRKLP